MLNIKQLKKLIEYVNKQLGMHSESATNLLLGTCAQESRLGSYIEQIEGPAKGIFQMEPRTEIDIWDNFIKYRVDIAKDIYDVCGRDGPGDWLWYDLAYQSALCRIHYFRVPEPLPDSNDIEGLARYWKQHYNTGGGAGAVKEFIANYMELVDGKS